MRKTLLKLLLCIVLVCISACCWTACAEDGKDGIDGKDGVTPTVEISSDGYWVINGVKTETKAIGQDGENGEPGKDGQNGQDGANGSDGIDGKDGVTPTVEISSDGYWVINGVKTENKAIGQDGIDVEEVYLGEDGHLYVKLTGDTSARDLGLIVPPSGEQEGFSKGLEYCSNSDKTGYAIKGVGICLDKDIKIPSTYLDKPVTEIKTEAFLEENLITSIEIPGSVTSIGYGAFYNCTSLTSVEIGDSVASIGSQAFYNCTSLKSVEIPDSVTSIGYGAFSSCTSLTSVVIPDSVTTIGSDVFRNCTSLTSVEIPDSVTSIGNSAFYNCTSLTSVVIGDSVTSIGNYAFINCTSLTSVEIPDSVTSIGSYAFGGCSSLTSVTFKGRVAQWTAIEIGWLGGALEKIICTDGEILIGPFGTYKFKSLTAGGETYNVGDVAPWGDGVETISADYIVFELKADGVVAYTMTMGGETESMEGTWTQNGNAITITIEGEALTFTLDGKTLSYTYGEGEYSSTTVLEKA